MSRIDSWHRKISTRRHFQNGHHNTSEIQHCSISTKISYVGRLWWPELIPDIETFLPVSIFKMAATIPQKIKLRICHNAKCSFKPVVSGRFGRLHNRRIDSQHRKISTGLHFQNDHHNTAKIQHCSISKVAFDLFFKPVVSGQFGRFHNR